MCYYCLHRYYWSIKLISQRLTEWKSNIDCWIKSRVCNKCKIIIFTTGSINSYATPRASGTWGLRYKSISLADNTTTTFAEAQWSIGCQFVGWSGNPNRHHTTVTPPSGMPSPSMVITPAVEEMYIHISKFYFLWWYLMVSWCIAQLQVFEYKNHENYRTQGSPTNLSQLLICAQ